jgi:hypothetical protein
MPAIALSLKARLSAPEPGAASAAVAALRKAMDFGFDYALYECLRILTKSSAMR